MTFRATRRALRPEVTLVALVALLAARTVVAAGVFIEDLQIAKRGKEATVKVKLACPMRLRSDVSGSAGALLEVRVAPQDGCRQLGVGQGIASEAYRPESGALAHLTELEYESLGRGDNLLILHFDQPVDYRIAQRGDLRTLEVRVRVGNDSVPAVTATPPEPMPRPAPAAPRAEPPPAVPPAVPPNRAPITSRLQVPDVAPDYVINLQSSRDPVVPAAAAGVAVKPGQHLYLSTTTIDGTVWYRLRLGFFASERDASAVLQGLTVSFPRAWVGRAESDEVHNAASLALERGGGVAANTRSGPGVAESSGAPAPVLLPPGQIEPLLAEGRKALIAGDYATAIRDYARLSETPGDHRAEARENLGLAREKSGQAAFAATEYRRFLEEFPQSDAAPRVRQRLSNIVAATAQERLRAEQAAARRFEITTGLSQYYYRNVERPDQDQRETTTFSALLTDLDLTVRHRGDSLNMLGRLSLNDLHDMLGQGAGGGDRRRLSYAYYDVANAHDAWSVRAGRQSLHNWGVLGRFDGVHGTFAWADERRLHVTMGYPVESTLDGVKTDRQFIGVALDFDHLVGRWGFSPYVQSQNVAGISDRQAVGIETRYLDETRSLTTMLDYDTLYGEINTALVFGTWRIRNRITLTGLYDERTSIFTRNALIGQPVTGFEELLLSWTEEELRQMARDRSATSKTATLGISTPVGERLQINADVTSFEIGPSVDFAAMPAIPGTGQQVYYSVTLVTSALFGIKDVNALNLRYGEGPDFTTTILTWDTRLPLGKHLRLNPRLRFSTWENTATNVRRETLTPALRLLLNAPQRYRFELEVGRENLVRTTAAGHLDSTGKYLNLGYRADF